MRPVYICINFDYFYSVGIMTLSTEDLVFSNLVSTFDCKLLIFPSSGAKILCFLTFFIVSSATLIKGV